MKLTSQLSWCDIYYITLGKGWTTIKKNSKHRVLTTWNFIFHSYHSSKGAVKVWQGGLWHAQLTAPILATKVVVVVPGIEEGRRKNEGPSASSLKELTQNVHIPLLLTLFILDSVTWLRASEHKGGWEIHPPMCPGRGHEAVNVLPCPSQLQHV